MSTITTSMARGPRGSQEDRSVVVSLRDGYLLAVFDGHNGNSVSDFCAKRLPGLALQVWKDCQTNNDEYYYLRTIIQTLVSETATCVSGSTVSLAHVIESRGRVDVAVLGDSPVVVRSGVGSCWVSNEHNVRSNVKDRQFLESLGATIDHGYLCVECDGYFDKCLQLTRALGDSDFNAYLLREPECASCDLGDESIVALMSDGVYDQRVVRRPADLSSISIDNASIIVDGALQRGTHDNVTAIVWHA